ncbi:MULTISPECIES: hypothetical protein [Pseudomonas]|uniref:Uncharacterized protein n=2 Tax=Pseudomonas syringae group genomosp. 2 TaxID=251698 RepID=A0AAX1VKQ9_PSEAJ|nr:MULTISPECIES: hypothetical protein [Pseudomonas]KEZ25863.1 hypothetical protein A3SK_0119235 [Pseudomonas amygdali pv. tabaci str. 6605]MBP1138530.1 hypothetical protein [Pseudomonas sp. PvP009]RML74913.1 hypothetical protein ALQ89_04880 [Pseudomonas amygdali pv. tabaci]BCS42449.1 hypothetical protein Pta6605_07800 [Pseudomonas amygdali pv. tabaci]
MKKVKNAVGIRTDQHMHNTEDARVIVKAVPHKPERKWICKSKIAAKWLANFLLTRSAVWIWNNAGSIWDWLHSNVGPLL